MLMLAYELRHFGTSEKPSVPPDGRQVAFLSDRDGRRASWVIHSDGGAPRRVADVETVGSLSR
jgi:Tol biopolymer transport system component